MDSWLWFLIGFLCGALTVFVAGLIDYLMDDAFNWDDDSRIDPVDDEEKTCTGCRFRVVGTGLRLYDMKPEIGCSNKRMIGRLALADKRCGEYQP